MNTAELFTVNVRTLGIDVMEKKAGTELRPNRRHVFAGLKRPPASQDTQPEEFHSSHLG